MAKISYYQSAKMHIKVAGFNFELKKYINIRKFFDELETKK